MAEPHVVDVYDKRRVQTWTSRGRCLSISRKSPHPVDDHVGNFILARSVDNARLSADSLYEGVVCSIRSVAMADRDDTCLRATHRVTVFGRKGIHDDRCVPSSNPKTGMPKVRNLHV